MWEAQTLQETPVGPVTAGAQSGWPVGNRGRERQGGGYIKGGRQEEGIVGRLEFLLLKKQ